MEKIGDGVKGKQPKQVKGPVKQIQKRRLSSRTQIFHGNKCMDRRKKALEAFHKMKAWVEENEPEIAKKIASELKQRSVPEEEFWGSLKMKWRRMKCLSMFKRLKF